MSGFIAKHKILPKFSKSLFLDIVQANLNQYENAEWFEKRKNVVREVFSEKSEWRYDIQDGTTYVADTCLGKTLIVVLKGSDEPKDWWGPKGNMQLALEVPDTPVTKKVETQAQVHSGFLAAWKMAKSRIFDDVVKYKPAAIVISGHSRGAAAAAIGAENLAFRFEGIPVYGLYLSSPMPGNEAFRELHLSRVRDHVMLWLADDTVVRVPPWVLGYRSVSRAYRVPDVGWCPIRLFSWATSWPWDHYPDNVARAISAAF